MKSDICSRQNCSISIFPVVTHQKDPAREIFFHACSGPRVTAWVGIRVYVRAGVPVRDRVRVRISVRVRRLGLGTS